MNKLVWECDGPMGIIRFRTKDGADSWIYSCIKYYRKGSIKVRIVNYVEN